MATGWTLRQQASEKEQELQLLREQHTQLLEEAVKGVYSPKENHIIHVPINHTFLNVHTHPLHRTGFDLCTLALVQPQCVCVCVCIRMYNVLCVMFSHVMCRSRE